MSKIIKVKEFKGRPPDYQKMYDRLQRLEKKSRAEIEANPWPVIEAIQQEVFHLRKVLERIRDVIQPVPIFVEPGVQKYPEHRDIREEAVTKLLKIEEIVFNELSHQADSKDSAPD